MKSAKLIIVVQYAPNASDTCTVQVKSKTPFTVDDMLAKVKDTFAVATMVTVVATGVFESYRLTEDGTWRRFNREPLSMVL